MTKEQLEKIGALLAERDERQMWVEDYEETCDFIENNSLENISPWVEVKIPGASKTVNVPISKEYLLEALRKELADAKKALDETLKKIELL